MVTAEVSSFSDREVMETAPSLSIVSTMILRLWAAIMGP